MPYCLPYPCSYFTDEETTSQKGEKACLRSQTLPGLGHKSMPNSSAPNPFRFYKTNIDVVRWALSVFPCSGRHDGRWPFGGVSTCKCSLILAPGPLAASVWHRGCWPRSAHNSPCHPSSRARFPALLLGTLPNSSCSPHTPNQAGVSVLELPRPLSCPIAACPDT